MFLISALVLLSAFVALLGGGFSAMTSFLLGVLIFFGVIIIFLTGGTLYSMLRQNNDYKIKKRYR